MVGFGGWILGKGRGIGVGSECGTMPGTHVSRIINALIATHGVKVVGVVTTTARNYCFRYLLQHFSDLFIAAFVQPCRKFMNSRHERPWSLVSDDFAEEAQSPFLLCTNGRQK